MVSKKKLQQRLDACYGGAVTLFEENATLRLEGSVATWAAVVAAGQLCADKHCHRTVVNNLLVNGLRQPPMKLPQLRDLRFDGCRFDVVIVGAGVTGCAIARELSRFDLHVLLLDKEYDVALHASSRNDGMVHPGIDLKKSQLKFHYNRRGNQMYPTLCKQLEVDFAQTGQYLGFTNRWIKYILPLILLYFRSKGLRVHALSGAQLLQREPHLTPNIQGALHFPEAGIVCPYSLTIALAENAVENGVTLALNTAVTAMDVQDGKIISLTTNRGVIYPGVVVNAAGVFSDELARLAGDCFFSIHPRRGTNAILDKKAAFQVRTIASLLGTANTTETHSKGGGLVSTVDQNLLVGPNAVETPLREDFSTEKTSIEQIFFAQRQASPLLRTADIITYFTGVRAATYEEDFVVEKGRRTKNLVHAAGIQSPGLTAAPAIAQDVAAMAVALLQQERPVSKNLLFSPTRKAIPNPRHMTEQERNTLIAANPAYGEIICRCEEVSRGEIIAALHRSVPCSTVDGVKRRVRPGMGRCQGGFCGPLVAGIIACEKNIPLTAVCKGGAGSRLLFCSTKEACACEQQAL